MKKIYIFIYLLLKQKRFHPQTNIFFIRRSEEPDKPYFTLEYKNGAINQNRGYDNQDPPLEVVGFASEWLEYVKSLNTVKVL